MKNLIRRLIRWATREEVEGGIAMPMNLNRHDSRGVEIMLATNGYILSYYDHRSDKRMVYVTTGNAEEVGKMLITVLGHASLEN